MIVRDFLHSMFASDLLQKVRDLDDELFGAYERLHNRNVMLIELSRKNDKQSFNYLELDAAHNKLRVRVRELEAVPYDLRCVETTHMRASKQRIQDLEAENKRLIEKLLKFNQK